MNQQNQSLTNTDITVTDVIIVGAGVAGLTCANKLKKKGISCIILEARDRIGGRIESYGFNGVKVDLGASFIHGASDINPVYRLSIKKKLELKKDFGTEPSWIYHNGQNLSEVLSKSQKLEVEATFYRAFSKIIKFQEEIESNRIKFQNPEFLTVQDALEQVLSKLKWGNEDPRRHYYNHIQWEREEYEGVDFENQSLISFDTETHIAGGNVVLKNSFVELIDALAIKLDIRLKHVVQSIEDYNTEDISVRTNLGNFKCKRIVVTVPIGVLKSQMIKFIPELPEWKKNSINNLQMGLMNKVYLHFPEYFWDKNLSRINYVSESKGEFPWVESYSNTEPILLCWIACSFAEKLEELSDEEIIERIMVLLRKIFNKSYIPDPVDYRITRWKSDPYSGGSWSVKCKGASKKDNDNLFKNVSNLYFCGEATTSQFPGTITGAYITAKEQSGIIISSMVK